jgi:hypothetical protein
MNAKIDFDIFLITLQLTTFKNRGKPRIIIRLVCNAICQIKLETFH